MKTTFLLAPCLLSFVLFASCGTETESSDGEGGSGGQGEPACTETGQGTLEVTIEGLPDGLDGDVTIAVGAETLTLTGSETFENTAAGPITVTAAHVTDTDPIVRTVYDPTVSEGACVEDGATLQVTVTYAPIPTSHHLWVTNGNETFSLLGFPSEDLSASGTPDATPGIESGAGNDVAFDRDGHLWTFGGTLAEAHLLRFSADDLGSSGKKTPDREINIPSVECIPAMRALAFASDGTLWVSTCGGTVFALTSADLAQSGEVTPDTKLSGLTDNGDLAFDAAGNLWVADDTKLARYDAARLGASTSDPADFVLTLRNEADTSELTATNLVFAKNGDLWSVDFGGNGLSRVPASELAGEGTASVAVPLTVTIGVAGLLDRPAFDDGGGLWLSLSQGKFGRLSPAQLEVSTTAGEPTLPEIIVESGDTGYAGRLAFFPAASGLPLYHSYD